MTATDQPMPPTFLVRIIGSDARAVRLVVKGELDIANAPHLDAALERAFAEADDVVLDLSGVEFIDSSGLYAVVIAVREAPASGKRLRISASLSAQVQRLFDLAGMKDALPLVED
jgi:anti-sigma B factor antagonist